MGVYFDTNKNVEFHVKKLVQSCFYQIRNIAEVRIFFMLLFLPILTIIIHSFLRDFSRLQLEQNASVGLLTRTKLFHHITPV